MGVTLAEIAALATALGIGGAVREIGQGVKASWTGRAATERQSHLDAIAQRDDAWRLVDKERARADAAEVAEARAITAKRKALEHASILRRMLIVMGCPEEQLPEWPTDAN